MGINFGRALARAATGALKPYADRINAEKDAEVARKIAIANIPIVARQEAATAKATHVYNMELAGAGRAALKPIDSFTLSANEHLASLYGDDEINPFAKGYSMPYSGSTEGRRADQRKELTELYWGNTGRRIAKKAKDEKTDLDKALNLARISIKKTPDWDQLTTYVRKTLSSSLKDSEGTLPPLTSLFSSDMIPLIAPIIEDYMGNLQGPVGSGLIEMGVDPKIVGNLFATRSQELENSPYRAQIIKAMGPDSGVQKIIARLSRGEINNHDTLVASLRKALPSLNSEVEDDAVLQILVDSASFSQMNSKSVNGQPQYMTYPRNEFQDVSGERVFRSGVELVDQVDAVAEILAASGENQTLPLQSDAAITITGKVLDFVSSGRELYGRFIGKDTEVTDSSAQDSLGILKTTLLQGKGMEGKEEVVDAFLSSSTKELEGINKRLQSTDEQALTQAKLELKFFQAKTVLMFSIAKTIQGGGGGNAVSNADFQNIKNAFNLAVSGDPQQRAEAFLGGLRYVRRLGEKIKTRRNRSRRYMAQRKAGEAINYENKRVSDAVLAMVYKKQSQQSDQEFWNAVFKDKEVNFDKFYAGGVGSRGKVVTRVLPAVKQLDGTGNANDDDDASLDAE
tara:strand:+ start:2389 stop:4266 length:1878 start_codon:yes stop_codon:yes gene_type:complete